MLKQIISFSALAVILTACSAQPKEKSKPVESIASTTNSTTQTTSTTKMSSESGFNISELLNKDFSSAEGQYTSDRFIYYIRENGITVKAPHLDHEVEFKIKDVRKEDKFVRMTVSLPAKYTDGVELDAVFIFLPAGVGVPATVADLGDGRKDRVLLYNPDRTTSLLTKK